MDAQPVGLVALSSDVGLSRANKYIRRVVAEITFDGRLDCVGAVEGAALTLEICSCWGMNFWLVGSSVCGETKGSERDKSRPLFSELQLIIIIIFCRSASAIGRAGEPITGRPAGLCVANWMLRGK